MKASELRIGNWVIYQDEFDKIRYELKFSIGHFMGIFEKNYGPPEPIKLTEEWLVKFGFVYFKKMALNIPIHNYIINRKDPNNEMVLLIEMTGKFVLSGYDTAWTKPLLYVHELQNLYFALTGEELTIKE